MGAARSARPKLVILMGVPGAGKSYVASHLHRQYGFSVVSGESVTFALFQRDKCSSHEYATAYSVARMLTRELLLSGRSVVFDSSNVLRLFRHQIYRDVADIHCRIIGIFLHVSERCAQGRLAGRNVDHGDVRDVKSICTPQTLRSFYSALELPARDEPFVEVDAEAADVLDRINATIYSDGNSSAVA